MATTKSIYVLRHKERDVGEATSLEGLQHLSDTFGDLLVDSIRTARPLRKEVYNVDVRVKYLDENGLYVAVDSIPPTIQNKHADFFLYLITYTRDLYVDLETDSGATTVLLKAIAKKGDLNTAIMRFEKSWYNEQLAVSQAAGVGLTIRHFPVCEAAAELATLNANVVDALEQLERKSLLIKDPFVPRR